VSGDSLFQFDWPLPRGVRAAFTTRNGGRAPRPGIRSIWPDTGDVGDRVLGVLDDSVLTNARYTSVPHHLTWILSTIGYKWSGGPVTGDASITGSTARVCVILVADCLPVLFATRDGRRIGAAHAGWRGLAGGVLEATVKALAVDPSTSPPGWGRRDLRDHLKWGQTCAMRSSVRTRARRRCSRPPAAAGGRSRGPRAPPSRAAGRRVGGWRHWCTYADRTHFYSYRRDGGGGRMAALIWKE
jgi:hypothetical protein